MACTIRQMCDFAGWPVLGWLSPGGIPCLGSVFPLRYRVRAKSSSFPTPAVIDVHITPDVGAISSAPRAPVANRAHTAGTISAAPRQVAVAAQLRGWMLGGGTRDR